MSSINYFPYHSISHLTVTNSFGVNVYGWMKGDFGGGTTARCIVQSLLSNNLSVSAITINGADLHSHSNKMIQKLHIPQNPQDYLFDILAINAANTLPILTDSSNGVYMNHYRIGLWHWETSSLPADQGILGGYYDEIWAPSEYVAQALLSTPSFPPSVRVSIVPYGYETLPKLVTQQERFHARTQLLTCIPSLKTQLSAKKMSWSCSYCSKFTIDNMLKWSQSSTTRPYTTLFLVIFDFNSDYQRKNILGIISAFRAAFPHFGNSEHTGLIIKSSNAQHQPNDYANLLSTLDNYDDISKRIILMDGVLSSSSLLTLKQSVDCYISLHRSEGWGLNILESVLMGIPVIHTAFGGSEQFMKPLYRQLLPELRIPYTLSNISRPFGPYTTSMMWAEPSHGAAVHALSQVHASLSYYQSHAHNIRSHAIQLLSPSSTGGLMLQRLRKISYCLCQIYEHFPQRNSIFFPSKCHPTTISQNQMIEKIIFHEIQIFPELFEPDSSSSEPHPPPRETSDITSNVIIDYCHKYILGNRILKEKYKRLK